MRNQVGVGDERFGRKIGAKFYVVVSIAEVGEITRIG